MVQKKVLEFSIKGWVGGSGGCQCLVWPTHPPKKLKKSWSKMANFGLKWILKACFFLFFYGYCPHPDTPTHPNMDKSIYSLIIFLFKKILTPPILLRSDTMYLSINRNSWSTFSEQTWVNGGCNQTLAKNRKYWKITGLSTI